MKKRLLSLLVGSLAASMALTGCGSMKSDMGYAMRATSDATNDDAVYSYDEYAASEWAAEEDCYDEYYVEEANSIQGSAYYSDDDAKYDEISDASSSSTDVLAEDKLVYEAYVTIETLDFDETYAQLTDLIRSYGGRIDSENYDAQYKSYTSNDRYRSGYHTTRVDNIVIRIPSEHYNEFMASDSNLGNVTYKTQSLTNISQQYYSSTTRIELLEGQKEYYEHQLELIEEQLMDCQDYEYVIDQMVDLEDRIISVQNEINSLRGSVKTMDMQVAYSTITLTLEEVKEYTDITPVTEEEEDTFLSRLMDSIEGSKVVILTFLEFLLTALIYLLPFAIFFGLITLIIVLIIKSAIKKSRQKKAVRMAAMAKPVINKAVTNQPAVTDDKKDENEEESLAKEATESKNENE